MIHIENLSVKVYSQDQVVHAVRGVSFSIGPGEIVGLVGESGSGKSVTAQAIMRLIPFARRVSTSGKILFKERDLLSLPEPEMNDIRGKEIGIIFQDSYSSFNPTMTIGEQLVEALRRHRSLSKEAAFTRGIELLFQMGINSPSERMDQYPHELSGGMRQRVLLAMAIGLEPELLIADEPTTALDVPTQAQILRILKNLGCSILFISHDLNVVSKICDRIYVMYAGQIVEESETAELFAHPKHPYTQALIRSIPSLTACKNSPLQVIGGTPPHPLNLPTGCCFHPRCPKAMQVCALHDPHEQNLEIAPCFLYHPMAKR